MTPAAYLTLAGSADADEGAAHLSTLSRRDLESLGRTADALGLSRLATAIVAEDARREEMTCAPVEDLDPPSPSLPMPLWGSILLAIVSRRAVRS